jgi:hypothetical protein
VQHGVDPQIVITLYPGGTIGLRELRRKVEYRLDAGALYVGEVRKAALAERSTRSTIRRRR